MDKYYNKNSMPQNKMYFNYERALVPYLFKGKVTVRGDSHSEYLTHKDVSSMEIDWIGNVKEE